MLLTTCLVACGKTKADYKLAVRTNSWYYGTADGANSGDDPGVEFEVETGKSYSYGSGAFTLNFEITKIKDDSIVIKTTEVFSSSEDGVNLRSNKKEFTITFDEETILSTPTMDTGATYYLILKK